MTSLTPNIATPSFWVFISWKEFFVQSWEVIQFFQKTTLIDSYEIVAVAKGSIKIKKKDTTEVHYPSIFAFQKELNKPENRELNVSIGKLVMGTLKVAAITTVVVRKVWNAIFAPEWKTYLNSQQISQYTFTKGDTITCVSHFDGMKYFYKIKGTAGWNVQYTLSYELVPGWSKSDEISQEKFVSLLQDRQVQEITHTS